MGLRDVPLAAGGGADAGHPLDQDRAQQEQHNVGGLSEYLPRCNAPAERDEHGTYMVNGISVGWADVYNWFLADQYIGISGVPDGL